MGNKSWLLLVGILALAVGFGVGRYTGFVGKAPAKVRTVTLRLAEGQLTYDHAPIIVSVGRQDKVRWESEDFQEFTLRISYVKVADRREVDPEILRPENPFGEGTPEWSTQTGVIELGPALRGAIGHQYKFTIVAGDQTLDPHIEFERGGGDH